jgi:small subunit ribosomal protein S11
MSELVEGRVAEFEGLGICFCFSPAMFTVRPIKLLATVGRPRLAALISSEPNPYEPNPYSALLSGLVEASLPPAVPPPDRYPPAPPPKSYSGHSPFGEKKIQKTRYKLHIFSSRNNTIATFTHGNGDVIAVCSGGSCGFKKSHRSGYEAGYQVAVKIFKRVEQELPDRSAAEVELCFKGFGQGRDAVQKALLTSEGEGIRPMVFQLTDRTPLKIGGTRSKKARRL